MALLQLRKWLLPNHNTTNYALLPTTGTGHDFCEPSLECERAGSQSEKDACVDTPRRRFHVDPRIISDATIGLSDGLTVPFALTAGLSALGDSKLVIYGGLAELIAGGISMGLGGYLGAAGEAQAYEAALAETRNTVSQDRDVSRRLVTCTLEEYGFPDGLLDSIATELSRSASNTERFLMRFHHRQLPESSGTASRPYISALTISLGYFLGGLTPLAPYFVFHTNQMAFLWSVAVMGVALFLFGYIKTWLVGEAKKSVCFKGGVQMVCLGGVAAAAAMGCVKAIGT